MCLVSRAENLVPGLLKQTRGLERDDGRMLRGAGLRAACTGGWGKDAQVHCGHVHTAVRDSLAGFSTLEAGPLGEEAVCSHMSSCSLPCRGGR